MAGSTQRREYDFYQAKNATLFFIEVVMTYNLCINDSRGKTQKWWIDFLRSLPHDVDHDIPKELEKWGGRLDFDRYGHTGSIIFDKEEDLTMFLLRWS